MKRYTLSFADSTTHKPEHPERTAKRASGWDMLYQVWPNRPSMATTIRMQQRKGLLGNSKLWKPIIPLTDGEGY